MSLKAINTFSSLVAIAALMSSVAFGQTSNQGQVRVGVLTDMSGFTSDANGKGSVTAAQLAAEEFAAQMPDKKIEVIFADHQNKPDVGAAIARRWVENEGVNVILDVPVSSVALAVGEVVRASKAIMIVSGSGSTELTGARCSPHTIQWTYDTWALSRGTAKAVTEAGFKRWFFLTADYSFGHALERDASLLVKASGGTVIGSVRHPINSSDFSSFLLQAQASNADVIAFANAVGDTINSVKQSSEFGIGGSKQKLVTLLLQLTDVHSLGLKAAQGLYLTQPFYWDMNEQTRKFSDRYMSKDGRRPTDVQAGVYASLLHYLKAVKKTNSTDGDVVVAAMKDTPTDDPLFGRGYIRKDGRKVHDMYVLKVKSPSESKGPWDYFELVSVVPGAEAFRPEADGGCYLVK